MVSSWGFKASGLLREPIAGPGDQGSPTPNTNKGQRPCGLEGTWDQWLVIGCGS